MKKLLMLLLLLFWALPVLEILSPVEIFAFESLFDARIDYGAGDGSQSVFCADLDNDDDLDLAVANNLGRRSVGE